MVLVVEACDVRQVMQQLARLIDVLSVEEVATEPAHVDSFVEAVLRLEMPNVSSPPTAFAQETAR
jgi:acetolactate synthase small subunit